MSKFKFTNTLKKMGILLLLGVQFLTSCEDYDVTNPIIQNNNGLNSIKVENGIVNLPSKDFLNTLIKDYRDGINGQNKFNEKIKLLQSKGFKPLVPIFEGLDEKELHEYVLRKKNRLQRRNADYGLLHRDSRDSELDLDDEIVDDPFLAALLNEDREIIIADILYKYTELGLLFIQKDNKQIVLNYINSKTPQEKLSIIMLHKSEFSTTDKAEEKIEALENGITSFRMLNVNPISSDPDNDGGGGGSGGGSGSGNSDGNIGGNGGLGLGDLANGNSTSGTGSFGNGVFDPTTFGTCTIESQGFFEGIFGETESSYEYYNDNRRVKVRFWNQNYFVFASIGALTKFQKREHLNVLVGTISWWEQSFADTIRLGINNITFKYNFNVPVFNLAQFNYETTFFEYNGTKYNYNGQVIPTVPTSAGSFNFPVNSDDNVVNMTFAGINNAINNGQINQAIDFALDRLIDQVQSYAVKQQLQQKRSLGVLEVRAVYAVPNTNSVKFIIAKQNWGANNENAIAHYFDCNFLISYNSSTNYNTNTGQGITNYLQAFNGATSYSEVKADLYGAALHNNFWKGRRLYSN